MTTERQPWTARRPDSTPNFPPHRCGRSGGCRSSPTAPCAGGRRWRGNSWLSGYFRTHRAFDRRAIPAGVPIDVMVMVADHYEPARRDGDAAAVESVRLVVFRLRADCRPAPRFRRPAAAKHLVIPLRLPQPGLRPGAERDDLQRLRRGRVPPAPRPRHPRYDGRHAPRGRRVVQPLRRHADSRGAAAQDASGYVAGNSALDNGAGDDKLSGCNTEIRALRDAGCYADFTFSSLGSRAQPRTTNSIYYATEDGLPKSYDTGVPVEVGRPASGDLMIFQGPTAFDWRHGRIDDGSVENSSPPHPRRLGAWLKANVHVPGRPEWVFVKLHTHAMQNRASFLSSACDATFAAMEHWWARPPFRLHYVTAREVYNIARAAEAGHSRQPRRLPRLRPRRRQPTGVCSARRVAAAELVARPHTRRTAGTGFVAADVRPPRPAGRWPAGCAARWKSTGVATSGVAPPGRRRSLRGTSADRAGRIPLDGTPRRSGWAVILPGGRLNRIPIRMCSAACGAGKLAFSRYA